MVISVKKREGVIETAQYPPQYTVLYTVYSIHGLENIEKSDKSPYFHERHEQNI